MSDGPPSEDWTLADLELIRLEISMDPRLGRLTATLSPEDLADWEEQARRRAPGELPVAEDDLAPSERVPAMAEEILAELTRDARTLRALAGSRYQNTLMAVAANPACPAAVRSRLAAHRSPAVRRAALTASGRDPS